MLEGMGEVDAEGDFTVIFWTRVVIWVLTQSYSGYEAGFHLLSS